MYPEDDNVLMVEEPEAADVLDEQVELLNLTEADPDHIPPDVSDSEVKETRDE